MAKHAGLGAAVAVLLAFSGLIVLVGVILLMMWLQPGIEHSPSLHSEITPIRHFSELRTLEIGNEACPAFTRSPWSSFSHSES